MARSHLRGAKQWSLERWGKKLTQVCFRDLDAAARRLAENHTTLPSRMELTGDPLLRAYPVREHFLIYVPVDNWRIAIVAVIRQGRDLPALCARHRSMIERELQGLRAHKPSTPELEGDN